MSSESKHLLGFGDFPEAHVGAVKPTTKTATAGKGKATYKPANLPTGKSSGKKSPHGLAAIAAGNAGKKALAVAKAAEASNKGYEAAAKSGKHAPLVPVVAKKTAVGMITIGAAPGTPLTAKQAKAVDKHTGAIAKHAMAQKNLAIAAAKAKKAGDDALAAAGEVARAALKMAGKSMPKGKTKVIPKTTIKGEVAEVLGYLEALGPDGIEELDDETKEMLGEMLGGDASGLLPGQPGYNPTTDPTSPSYVQPYGSGVSATSGYDAYGNPIVDPYATSGTGTAGLDSSTGIVTDKNGSVLYDPSQDADLVAIPTRGGTLSQTDAQVVWQNAPEDSIAWDASGKVPNSLGSWLSFYGPQKDGFGQFGVTFGYHSDGWQDGEKKWTKRFGQADITGNDNRDDLGTDDAVAAAESLKNDTRNNKTGKAYGPIIGNPTGPYAGVQYANADKRWFFQSQNAPAQFCTEADSKITVANQKIVDAKTKAALALVAQQNAEDAANAEALAKQQAAQALSQQAAEADQTLTQTKMATADVIAQQSQDQQMAQGDIDYQKMQDTQQNAQAQARLERQKQRATAEAEAAHELISEAATYNQTMAAYAQSHPEEALALMQAQNQAPAGADPVDEFDDGGQSLDGGPSVDDEPSMFEEKYLPQYEDEV